MDLGRCSGGVRAEAVASQARNGLERHGQSTVPSLPYSPYRGVEKGVLVYACFRCDVAGDTLRPEADPREIGFYFGFQYFKWLIFNFVNQYHS